MHFNKLFSTISSSTIWGEAYPTRILWTTMLSMSDVYGEVHASIPGLARQANITIDECRAGLQTLLSPDPDSRTKDHDGRRIKEIDGGWQLLNHAKYRAIISREDKKRKDRERIAAERAAAKAQEGLQRAAEEPPPATDDVDEFKNLEP